jgi:hypothetical protein
LAGHGAAVGEDLAMRHNPSLVLGLVILGLLSLSVTSRADERQGGETIGSSVIIFSLPFDANGTTAGYQDDYDAPCPDSSDSPDVVYSFTNNKYYEDLKIDVCGADYDTKIYVFDAEGQEVLVCNDDYPCGDRRSLQSRIDHFSIVPYGTYYIVIDGSHDESGSYWITVADEGACCLPSGDCIMTTESECAGTWMGVHSTCEGTECPSTPTESPAWGRIKARFLTR